MDKITIIKRDGRKVSYNEEKPYNAILNACKSIDKNITDDDIQLANKIKEFITNHIKDNISVEEIQDMIENKLMQSNRKDVAKAYILYRDERNRVRYRNSELTKRMAEKLNATNIQNQNANVDEHSFGGRKGEADSIIMKDYALNYCMSEKSKQRHLNNEIYIHDLDSYAVGQHNCLSIPFDKLLKSGFNTRQTDVRPARSVSTAFQLVAVIFQLQSLQQFGGVSATHIDWTMVPYVRMSFYKHYKDGLKYIEGIEDDKFISENINDEMSILDDKYKEYKRAYEYAYDMVVKEIYQSVEAMYHNLNTLQSRSGNQLPFTSLNYGTCTQEEGRLVTKALLEVSIEGIGKLHRTSVFPCGIFQYMKGVNDREGTPNYDLYQLALKSTSLRLYPNYANVDWSGNAGYDRNDPRTYFSTMGCRTANGWDINGFGQLKDGRGNICPVTIILPTIAMESVNEVEEENKYCPFAITEKNYIDKFMEKLETAIDDSKDMLIERFEWICSQPSSSATFMYENGTMEGYIPEEGIRSALKHGTLAVGQIGLAETLQILIHCDHTEEKGMELAKRIEQLFKDKCAKFKQEYKLNFGVYYTPAENLCYTAMQKFKDQYGVIPNVSENEFFTNSNHVPVWKNIDIFDKIKIESELTGYSSAGCITYVELDSACKYNLKALETIVNYAMDMDVPYLALNVPNDQCCKCGYTDLINKECPMCGSEDIRRLRRVTGYLTGDYKTAFNKGKQQEVEMRVKHDSSWQKQYQF